MINDIVALVHPRDEAIKSTVEFGTNKLVLFPGKIVRKNGALAFCGTLAQFFLTVSMGKAVWLKKVNENEDICVGVPAKYVKPADSYSADVVHFSARVESAGHIGNCSYIDVSIGPYSVRLNRENGVEVHPGEPIKLQFSRSRALLFRCPPDLVEQDSTPLTLAMA